MTLTVWTLYVLVVTVAVATPGPAVLLAINNAILGGLRQAFVSSIGNIVGIGLLSGVAILGLGTALQASASLFTLLKVIGALYLVFLGVQQWRKPIPRAPESTVSHVGKNTFARGVLVSLSNPKAILFFTALFPQFVDHERSVPVQFALMTLTFMAFSFMALMFYAAIAKKAQRWMRSNRGEKLFRRVSGSLFVLLGAGLLSSVGRASART